MTSSTHASDYVADTMALVLRIEKRKLSQTVKEIFEHMESGSLTIYIPGMVFAEILYLSARHKIGINKS
ncbi:hypothetical protein L0337_45375 [candidate division KSB1 bacterium]|nr:hypothetical protein [candidate division KSB1 bacterium]